MQLALGQRIAVKAFFFFVRFGEGGYRATTW